MTEKHEAIKPTQKLNSGAATPRPKIKAKVRISGQPVKGAQNNGGAKEPWPAGPASEKSKTVFNHENNSEVMSKSARSW